MIISYILVQPDPTYNYEYGNKHVSCDCIEDDDMDSHFIDYISTHMYEFCSKKYGHGIDISSYDEYCEHYWENQDYKMKCPVFEFRFFKNNVWSVWNVDDYTNEIYASYLDKRLKEQ